MWYLIVMVSDVCLFTFDTSQGGTFVVVSFMFDAVQF